MLSSARAFNGLLCAAIIALLDAAENVKSVFSWPDSNIIFNNRFEFTRFRLIITISPLLAMYTR
jgi:hypothetical protein